MKGFLSEGFRELGRKLARWRLAREIRRHDSERLAALADLGQKAWEGQADLAAHAALTERLAALDTRAGELSQEASRLEKEKAALEGQRRKEVDAFSVRRKAVEAKKSPVDAAQREARSRKSAAEQVLKQGESRLAAIAGRLAALERDLASPEKVAAAQAERTKLAAEQGELGTKLAAARTQLPGHAAEESRLAAESQRHAAEIAAIDAEQKAALGALDGNLTRVRTQLQGATQQSGAVQKDRSGAFRDLGTALYEAGAPPPALAEPTGRVASIDRGRAQAESARAASLAETRSLAGATMALFWSVMVGVPLLLAALGFGAYKYMHRDAPAARAAPAPQVASSAKSGFCEFQKAPDNGKGVGVRSDCTRSEGTFVKGRLQSGKITYRDGRVREGTFVNDQQMGKGTLAWPDGRRYEGTFVEGRSWGPGVFVAADGTTSTGMFEPGLKLVGVASRKSPDGTVLIGEFVNGKPSRKMVRVKDGKSEIVEPGDGTTPPAKGTATLEVQ